MTIEFDKNNKNLMSFGTKKILEQKVEMAEEVVRQAHLSIGEAGGTNDWHDNPAFDHAQYQAALAIQALSVLKRDLENSEIITPRMEVEDVGLGNKVILDFGDGEIGEYNVLGPADASYNRDSTNLSYKSPTGKAIIGHKAGDSVVYETCDHLSLEVKIVDIQVGDF